MTQRATLRASLTAPSSLQRDWVLGILFDKLVTLLSQC